MNTFWTFFCVCSIWFRSDHHRCCDCLLVFFSQCSIPFDANVTRFTLQFVLWFFACIIAEKGQQSQPKEKNEKIEKRCIYREIQVRHVSGKSQRDIVVFVYCPFTRIRQATNSKNKQVKRIFRYAHAKLCVCVCVSVSVESCRLMFSEWKRELYWREKWKEQHLEIFKLFL